VAIRLQVYKFTVSLLVLPSVWWQPYRRAPHDVYSTRISLR